MHRIALDGPVNRQGGKARISSCNGRSRAEWSKIVALLRDRPIRKGVTLTEATHKHSNTSFFPC